MTRMRKGRPSSGIVRLPAPCARHIKRLVLHGERRRSRTVLRRLSDAVSGLDRARYSPSTCESKRPLRLRSGLWMLRRRSGERLPTIAR